MGAASAGRSGVMGDSHRAESKTTPRQQKNSHSGMRDYIYPVLKIKGLFMFFELNDHFYTFEKVMGR